MYSSLSNWSHTSSGRGSEEAPTDTAAQYEDKPCLTTAPSTSFSLGGYEAHVWLARAEMPSGGRATVERSQNENLHDLRQVKEHLIRQVLSGYTRLPEMKVVLRRAHCWLCNGAHGKPYLDARMLEPLHFSVATDHVSVAAIVVARDIVGLDIERQDALTDWTDLAPSLTYAETTELLGLPERQRAAAALRRWVRREADVKTDGRGLVYDTELRDVPDWKRTPWWSRAGHAVQDLELPWSLVGALGAARPLRVSTRYLRPGDETSATSVLSPGKRGVVNRRGVGVPS